MASSITATASDGAWTKSNLAPPKSCKHLVFPTQACKCIPKEIEDTMSKIGNIIGSMEATMLSKFISSATGLAYWRVMCTPDQALEISRLTTVEEVLKNQDDPNFVYD